MNAAQRKIIEEKSSELDDLIAQFQQMADEEREKFESLSEGLQQSQKGEALESAANFLDEVVNNLEGAKTSLDEASQC